MDLGGDVDELHGLDVGVFRRHEGARGKSGPQKLVHLVLQRVEHFLVQCARFLVQLVHPAAQGVCPLGKLGGARGQLPAAACRRFDRIRIAAQSVGKRVRACGQLACAAGELVDARPQLCIAVLHLHERLIRPSAPACLRQRLCRLVHGGKGLRAHRARLRDLGLRGLRRHLVGRLRLLEHRRPGGSLLCCRVYALRKRVASFCELRRAALDRRDALTHALPSARERATFTRNAEKPAFERGDAAAQVHAAACKRACPVCRAADGIVELACFLVQLACVLFSHVDGHPERQGRDLEAVELEVARRALYAKGLALAGHDHARHAGAAARARKRRIICAFDGKRLVCKRGLRLHEVVVGEVRQVCAFRAVRAARLHRQLYFQMPAFAG